MVPATEHDNRRPIGLVVNGEASRHVMVLQKLLMPGLVDMYDARNIPELLAIVRHGRADMAVIDSDQGQQELLKTLRMIRRINTALPVVLVVREVSRRFMESALRLTAFSIVHKPLEREELLIQLRRILERFYPAPRTSRDSPDDPRAPWME